MFDALTRRPPPRLRRTVVLFGSMVLHGAVGVAAVVAAMVQVEKLVPDRMEVVLRVPPSIDVDPGEEPKRPLPALKRARRPKRPPPVTTQPPAEPNPIEALPVTDHGDDEQPLTDGGEGPGGATSNGPPCLAPPCDATPAVLLPVPICGDGAVDPGEACDDGNRRDGDGCSATCTYERPVIVTPHIVEGLRISGDERIQPPADVQTQMVRDGKNQVRGTFRLCLDATGRVTSTRALKSTGYPKYDERLNAGMQQWKYRPYISAGKPVPVCSVVHFVYVMQ